MSTDDLTPVLERLQREQPGQVLEVELDREHGEWFGYLHRDGRVSSRAKGTIYKGPFHLPRMLWHCWQRLEQAEIAAA